MQAIVNGDLGLLATIINTNNELSLELNNEGFNALHFACYCGYQKVVEFLLSFTKIQEIVNKADHEGWIPLHWAAYGNHREVIELLLKHDGAPRRKNNDKKIPQKLTSNPELKALLHPFHPDETERKKANWKLWLAVRRNNKNLIREALHLGADIECDDPGTNIDPLIRSSKGFPIQQLFTTFVKPDPRMCEQKGYINDNDDALFYFIEQGGNTKHLRKMIPSNVEYIKLLEKKGLHRTVMLIKELRKKV